MKRARNKPTGQMRLPLERGDCRVLAECTEHPVEEGLLERIIKRENLIRSLRQVERNGGSAGVDGMSVKELRPYLKGHWSQLRKEILEGTYRPHPVRRSEIPKSGGGIRSLGVPTVLDRFIQQAILQVVQELWEPSFSIHSYGFRPGRNAHQAVIQAQKYIRQGYTWVVEIGRAHV